MQRACIARALAHATKRHGSDHRAQKHGGCGQPTLTLAPPLSRIFRSQRDIKDNNKLNFHLYLALKRALYKPSAFFKGLLLPLCESQCTVREALIISSVLQKVPQLCLTGTPPPICLT